MPTRDMFVLFKRLCGTPNLQEWELKRTTEQAVLQKTQEWPHQAKLKSNILPPEAQAEQGRFKRYLSRLFSQPPEI